MPVLMAIVAASLVAWVIEDALPSPGGVPLPAAIALVAWMLVFVLLKRLLTEMRPGE